MITSYALAESHPRDTYKDDVYAHVSALASVEFSRSGSRAQFGRFRLTMDKYESLGQAAFEEADRIEHHEAQEVDWGFVDREAQAFETALAASIPSTQKPDLAERLVSFSAESFEHWLIYDQMYPKSVVNPWNPAHRLLERGRPFMLAPTEGLSVAKKTKPTSLGLSELSAVVKSSANGFGWMPIDGRYELQARVLAFLKDEAPGHEHPISLKNIGTHLRAAGVSLQSDAIQINVTVPLKKAGVIGSTGKGHFFIRSHEDLVQSYCFHLSKVRSGRAIMARYQLREAEFGGLDLRMACEGGAINRLDPDTE